jgi:uncharacterized membrane protein YkvI
VRRSSKEKIQILEGSQVSDKSKWAVWSVAFVWFTTHFGGGFASGRQLVDFYVNYGWYAIFMPVLSAAIIALVLYFAWSFAVKAKVYDYRTWSTAFYKPLGALEPLFSLAIEVMYLIILFVATGVALSTGSTLLTQLVPGFSYIPCTIGIAAFIFALTIWGAETVRKAATFMAILIIGGMLIIYISNMVVNFPKFIAVLSAAPVPETTASGMQGGFWNALWQAVKYAGLQCALVGAYTAVADALNDESDVKKTTWIGFIVNAGVLVLATTGVLAHFPMTGALQGTAEAPSILMLSTPITYITQHGGGGNIGVALVSMIILLAVVSTGVGLIYGGARRISTWWMKRTGTKSSRKTDIISSAVYVVLSWGAATFGLIPLIQKGYAWVGILSTPLVVIPILAMGIFHKTRSNG